MKELLRVIAVFVLVVGIGVPREMYAEEIPTNKYNIVHQIKDVFRSVLVDKPCRVRKYKDCFFFIATETELQRVHYVNGDKNNMEVESTQKARWITGSWLTGTRDSKVPFYYSRDASNEQAFPMTYFNEWWSVLSVPASLFADDAALRMFELEQYPFNSDYGFYKRYSGGLGRLWYIGKVDEDDKHDTVEQVGVDYIFTWWDEYQKQYSKLSWDQGFADGETLSNRPRLMNADYFARKKEHWDAVEEYKTRAEYTASSEHRKQYKTYRAKYLGIPIASGPWCEGVSGDGKGEWIEIGMRLSDGNEQQVLYFSNGYVSPERVELYESNGRVSQLLVSSIEGTPYQERYLLADTPHLQKIFIPSGVTRVKLTIEEVYKGLKWDDTCINFILPAD